MFSITYADLAEVAPCRLRQRHPNVNEKASTPESRNSIPNGRSPIGFAWQIN
jgi:hypothetical protein